MTILQDLRFAIRTFSKTPVTVLLVVLSLALGIGANSAVFSLVNQALFKRLPVQAPEELALFHWVADRNSLIYSMSGWVTTNDAGLNTSTSFSYPVFEEFDRRQEVFSSLFAFSGLGRINVSIEGQAELQSGQLVSGDYFQGLGLRPRIGRLIGVEDDLPGAAPVVVLAHSYWLDRLGGDPAVIGSSIQINSQTFTVVGVVQKGFRGTLQVGQAPALFIPLASQGLVNRGSDRLLDKDLWWIQVMGRLRAGVPLGQAQDRMNLLMEQTARGFWEEQIQKAEEASSVIPSIELSSGSRGLEEVRKRIVEPTTLAFAICGVILLIACANVANLMLARAAGREQEIAIRRSLGAQRGRLIRQLLSESLLLSFAGGGAGLLLAYHTGPAVISLMPSFNGDLSQNLDLRPDSLVVVFALLISLLTGLLFGLAPAFRATRVDLIGGLRASRSGSRGPDQMALTRGLVVVQVALSVALLVCAGLFLQTLNNLVAIDPGFSTGHVLVFKIDPTLNGYSEEDLVRLYQRIREEIGALPEVVSVTASQFVPLSNSGSWSGVHVAGSGGNSGQEGKSPSSYIGRVSNSYFTTLGIPILMGRGFRPSDDRNAPKVAIVNQVFARTLIGEDLSPLGRRIGIGSGSVDDIEIIGVIPDLRLVGLRREPEPALYVPLVQQPQNRGMSFAVRSRLESADLSRAVHQVVRSIDPNVPLFDVSTLNQQIADATTQERQFATLASIFGLLGVGLACLGLYGVLSHTAQRRTREIGIRMALGAEQGDILRMIMASLWLVLLGIGIGLGGAWAGTRLIQSMLFGLESADPWTLLEAAALMMLVASFAAYLPARRASRTPPMVALRCD